MVPADKAANNVAIVCRLHYINTLKQDLNGTKAYEETSIDEKYVVYSQTIEIPNKIAVDVKERQDRLPTMYWLPKVHNRPYTSRKHLCTKVTPDFHLTYSKNGGNLVDFHLTYSKNGGNLGSESK